MCVRQILRASETNLTEPCRLKPCSHAAVSTTVCVIFGTLMIFSSTVIFGTSTTLTTTWGCGTSTTTSIGF